MLINLKIHFTLFISKYGSLIECHRRLRNIAYISADRYLFACFGNLIWPRAIICIHDVFADRYTHRISHNRELYAWKRARARLRPRCWKSISGFDKFRRYTHVVDTYDFLLVSFEENNAFSAKTFTAMTISLLFVNSIHSTCERRLARDQNADTQM